MPARVALVVDGDGSSLTFERLLSPKWNVSVLPYRDRVSARGLRGADLAVFFHKIPRRWHQRLAARRMAAATRRLRIPAANLFPCQLRCRRDRMPVIWAQAGLPVPKAAPFRGRAGLLRALRSVGLPALVRTGYARQGGHAHRVESEADALALNLRWGVVLEFVDVRSDDGWYRRMRGVVFGERVVPCDYFGCRDWLVNLNAAGDEVRAWTAGPGAAEVRAFGAREEPPHADVLRRAARVLGLDTCAIDYSLRRDGSPVLWEANCCYGWYRWPDDHPIAVGTGRAGDALVAWVSELLSDGPAVRAT